MDKFTKIDGIAAPMPGINIDTDRIIPARFLKTIKKSGLGKNLFNDVRYTPDGKEVPDFVLNKAPYRKAQVIVAGKNFGCGSSREHAPWALKDFGIKAVISEDFADIFFNNSFKNGMLLIKLPADQIAKLMEDAEKGANARLTIDLEAQEITRPDGEKVKFDIDPFRKHCLLNGLDDIGLTLQKDSKIKSYESQATTQTPWLTPAG
ncbi:MAG: 3-isopropylmalate dehydratase small subunit [Rhodospirillales bacterium]